MFLTLALGLVIASVVFHELSHARWMRRYGLLVTEFGIGIPVPFLTLSFMWGATRVRISPVLLGAYVKTDEQTMYGLGWREQADIYGAGPLANIVFAGACFAVVGLMRGTWPPFVLYTLAAAVATLLFPRLVSRYVVPVAAVAMLALTVTSLMHTPDSMMGPAGMVQVLNRSTSFAMAIALAGSLSLAIAFMNLLPLFPLDAGRTWFALMHAWGLKRTAMVFANGGTFVLFALIALAFYSDGVRLLK